ncbi:hypothetical protein FisN_8Hh213 [Fistulifera solaris]|uniref:Uncharacterized protein n=1 Tax=Fistulifera solaris TaxID=1519565 RepID=A0A1Z5JYP6_FISSO|nr:hypothetical protein FisN_8Hh213 [Fistulifera solaris]|eukprot:GAX18992.1 hypothetical protein FisN_8Hh213 [Fistulifera solaris]
MMRFLLFLLLIPHGHGFRSSWKLPSPVPHVTPLAQSSISNVPNSTSVQQTSSLLQPVLLQRSSTAALSCMVTWATIQYTGWSIVRASSVVGMISALAMSPSFAAASLCGSFAGMSAHIATSQQAALLGLACGLVLYVWDAQQFQMGKGGRLGTIAYAGNLMYYSLRHGGPSPVVKALFHTLTPVTASTVAVASLVSFASKRPSQLLHQAAKAILWSSLFHRLLVRGVSLSQWGLSSACIFVASFLVRTATPWKGVVLATSLVGFLGSFTPWAAAVYLGAFIGMTGRANFKLRNLLEATLLSSILLELGLLPGFGGRLGFLAFLGVSFGL